MDSFDLGGIRSGQRPGVRHAAIEDVDDAAAQLGGTVLATAKDRYTTVRNYMEAEEQADIAAIRLVRKAPLSCFTTSKWQDNIGDDTRHPELGFVRVGRAYILEPSACILPARKGDTFGGRQQSLAADHSLRVADQPAGYVGGIADNGRDQHDLRLGRSAILSEVRSSS